MSPTHGEQESSIWNGHNECTCYHPLFVFNQFGDLERRALRPGNVHSADGWEGVLKPVVGRYEGKVSRLYFRADAAFATPGIYEYLETERISAFPARNAPAAPTLLQGSPRWRRDGPGLPMPAHGGNLSSTSRHRVDAG